MHSLMITKFLPLPANNGGLQRSLAVLEQLLELGTVVLCCFDDGTGDVRALEAMGADVRCVPWTPGPAAVLAGAFRTRSLSAGRFYSRSLVDVVRQAAGEQPLDVLQVEYSQMTPVAVGVRARTRCLDLHNVEWELVQSYARSRGPVKGLPYRAETVALKRLELQTVRRFDVVSVVSERDRRLLADLGRELLVCGNGWPLGDPLPASPEPVVTFVASLGWAPNSEAAVWFHRKVWPLVLAGVPEASLLLVGRDPSDAVRALAGPDTTVTGTVDDVRPYLARTRVALAPLLAGGGSRLKILEALAAERPVVATTVGASGLEDLIGSGVVVADLPQQMADTVVRLLRSPDEASELGRSGREAVASRYSWTQTLRPLRQAWQ